MKFLLVVFTVNAVAYADFRFSQQYPVDAREQEGPYQPRNWRPSGPSFVLPARQQLPRQEFGFVSPSRQQVPSQEFNPPPQTYGPPPTYGPPSQEYGPPETTTTEVQETTTELPTVTTTDNVQEAEKLTDSSEENGVKENEAQENEKLAEGRAAVTQQGIYYIYHPSGLLQRVIYTTRDDTSNMAYSARLKYENVEPIREPIYTYDPRTFVFRQLSV